MVSRRSSRALAGGGLLRQGADPRDHFAGPGAVPEDALQTGARLRQVGRLTAEPA
jgi:hypothetical protein